LNQRKVTELVSSVFSDTATPTDIERISDGLVALPALSHCKLPGYVDVVSRQNLFKEGFRLAGIGPLSQTVCGTANTTPATVPKYLQLVRLLTPLGSAARFG